MTIFLTILAVVVVAIAAILIYAATRPDSFAIVRSATVKAPPENLFPLVDDFHQWALWSPYEEMDTNLKKTFGGPPSGRGSTYAWEGDKTGTGNMEITESVPPRRVVIALEFVKPWKARNTAEFTFDPVSGGTTVTWAMRGPSPFVSRLMGVLMNFDRMVGGQFEQGLAKLKTVAETQE